MRHRAMPIKKRSPRHKFFSSGRGRPDGGMYRTRNLRITFSQSSACFSGLEERIVSSVKFPALVLLLWQPMQYWFATAVTGGAVVDGCCAERAAIVFCNDKQSGRWQRTVRARLRVKSLPSTNYE